MNFLWLLSFVCLLSVGVQPQPDEKIKVCGTALANSLATFCRGRYNNLWTKKNAPYLTQMDDYAYDQLDLPLDIEPKWPFLSRQSANSLLQRDDHHRRFRRGVVNECCKKSCTISELMSYCSS